MAGLFAFIDPNNDANLDLLQTCLYTRLPRTLSPLNPAPLSLSRSISIREPGPVGARSYRGDMLSEARVR
jgi:hypothetical protein